MEQEVLRHRNVVFNRIYLGSLTLYRACIPVPLRWFLEVLLLSSALLVLFLWGYVHFTYIVSSEDCLVNITERPFPRDVIFQVEVYSNTSDIWSERGKALLHEYTKLYSHHDSNENTREFLSTIWIRDYCESNMIVNLTGSNYFCELLLAELLDFTEAEYSENGGGTESSYIFDSAVQGNTCPQMGFDQLIDKKLDMCISKEAINSGVKSSFLSIEEEELAKSTFYSKNYTLFDLFNYRPLRVLVTDYTILEFSREPGYLSLSAQARSRLNISVVKTYLDPDISTCFGGPFGRFLTKYFLSYDMMVISSFKGLLPSNHASGYVKNLLTGSQYYYKVQWMGKWRYGAGLLPALFFTLVASVLLRRIHYHVFKFLTHFHHLLNQGIPMPIQTGAQIPFLVVTYATIGLVIVMSEALSDDSVFSLLMVGTVWEVDQFYSIYCKQETSKIYLPWFFFLYHFLPYAYYIRFNGQFWFIPFLFHWFLVQHAMLFFIHHCELPALDRANRMNFVNPPFPIRPPPVPDPVHEEDNNRPGDEELIARNEDIEEVVQPDDVNLHPSQGHLPLVEEDRGAEGDSIGLMRPQLHRTNSSSSQESISASREQQELSGSELRKIRLQHFERK